jgi:hypothetical protein
VTERPACRRCHAVLSAYRLADEPAGLCTACAAAEAAPEEWRLPDPESLVLAVAGVLASAVADRPGERAHVQAELEARGIIADHIDVHLAVASCVAVTGGASTLSKAWRDTAWRRGRFASSGIGGDAARKDGPRTRLAAPMSAAAPGAFRARC